MKPMRTPRKAALAKKQNTVKGGFRLETVVKTFVSQVLLVSPVFLGPAVLTKGA